MKSEITSQAIELYLQAEELMETMGEPTSPYRLEALLREKASDNDAVAWGYIRGLLGPS